MEKWKRLAFLMADLRNIFKGKDSPNTYADRIFPAAFQDDD